MIAGIENEVNIVGPDEKILSFSSIARKIQNSPNSPKHPKKSYIRWSPAGGQMYSDSGLGEVSTAPVIVGERGSISHLVDNLYMLRKEFFNLTSGRGYRFTGESTHLNLNTEKFGSIIWNYSSEIFRHIAPPLALLSLSPESKKDIKLRDRTSHGENRLEVTTEFIENLDQTNAFMLFYASILHKIEHMNQSNAERLPFMLRQRPSFTGNLKENDSIIYSHLLPEGRNTQLEIRYANGSSGYITAQEYLMGYFDYMKSSIMTLGSPSEVRNLWNFVSGEKALQIEERKTKYISDNYDDVKDVNYPIINLFQLIGEVLENGDPLGTIEDVEWDHLNVNYCRKNYTLRGMDEMMSFARYIHKNEKNDLFEALYQFKSPDSSKALPLRRGPKEHQSNLEEGYERKYAVNLD